MTEHWDGVRNYQARNMLRDEIKPGDGILIYYSSIPAPGIEGLAEAVTEGYPDWTALDPQEMHFDPKSSPDNPIWYMVDVRYVKPFARFVTLDEIRHNPELAGMELLKRSRLSIQPVSGDEWEEILRMGGVA